MVRKAIPDSNASEVFASSPQPECVGRPLRAPCVGGSALRGNPPAIDPIRMVEEEMR